MSAFAVKNSDRESISSEKISTSPSAIAGVQEPLPDGVDRHPLDGVHERLDAVQVVQVVAQLLRGLTRRVAVGELQGPDPGLHPRRGRDRCGHRRLVALSAGIAASSSFRSCDGNVRRGPTRRHHTDCVKPLSRPAVTGVASTGAGPCSRTAPRSGNVGTVPTSVITLICVMQADVCMVENWWGMRSATTVTGKARLPVSVKVTSPCAPSYRKVSRPWTTPTCCAVWPSTTLALPSAGSDGAGVGSRRSSIRRRWRWSASPRWSRSVARFRRTAPRPMLR